MTEATAPATTVIEAVVAAMTDDTTPFAIPLIEVGEYLGSHSYMVKPGTTDHGLPFTLRTHAESGDVSLTKWEANGWDVAWEVHILASTPVDLAVRFAELAFSKAICEYYGTR